MEIDILYKVTLAHKYLVTTKARTHQTFYATISSVVTLVVNPHIRVV